MEIDTSFYNPENEEFHLDVWLPKSRVLRCRTAEQAIELLCDLYHKHNPVEAEAFAREMEIVRSRPVDKNSTNRLVGSIPEFIYHGAEIIMEVLANECGEEWRSFWDEKNTAKLFKMYRVGSARDNGEQK